MPAPPPPKPPSGPPTEAPVTPAVAPSTGKGRTSDRTLQEILGGPPRRRPKILRIVAVAALAAVAAAAAFVLWGRLNPAGAPGYQTEPLARGDLVASVSATG